MEEERENKREQIRPGKQAVARSAEPKDLELCACSALCRAQFFVLPPKDRLHPGTCTCTCSLQRWLALQPNRPTSCGGLPRGLTVVLCSAGSALCPLPSDAPVPPATLYSGRRRCGPAKRARPVAVEPVASAGRWSRTNAVVL